MTTLTQKFGMGGCTEKQSATVPLIYKMIKENVLVISSIVEIQSSNQGASQKNRP